MEHLAVFIVAETVQSHGVFLDHHGGKHGGFLPAAQASESYWGGEKLIPHARAFDDSVVEADGQHGSA